MSSGCGAATGRRAQPGIAEWSRQAYRNCPLSAEQPSTVSIRHYPSRLQRADGTVWIDKHFADAAQCGWLVTDLKRVGKMALLSQKPETRRIAIAARILRSVSVETVVRAAQCVDTTVIAHD
jgi:hypothetical protein